MEESLKKWFNLPYCLICLIKMKIINTCLFVFFIPSLKEKPELLLLSLSKAFYRYLASSFIEKAYLFYRWLTPFLTSKKALFKNYVLPSQILARVWAKTS